MARRRAGTAPRRAWPRRRRAFAKDRSRLEAAERDFIVADMAKAGRPLTPQGLANFAPGRYDLRYLKAAMNRLDREGYLYKHPRRWGRQYPYSLAGKGAHLVESAERVAAA